jgi:SNF2 family DNA or RNA helicase
VDEDDTENYEDQPSTPSEDEKMPEEDNRRRSGRKRKPTRTVIDLSDDDFEMSSEEEEEKPKPKKKAATKSKGKKKRKRSSEEDSSDEESTFEDSEGEMVEVRAAPESDAFVIDKILGREVHTQKEWKKMCWGKNTRFLTHCSIFLPQEGEEEEKQVETKEDTHEQKEAEQGETKDDTEEQKETEQGEKKDTQEQKETEQGDKAATTESEPAVASKAVIEIDEVEDAGEERFLIKWKTLSYLHTSWQTEDELLETDKNAKGKIQRFREKEHRALYSVDVQGDEYFNPEFRSVDRILEIRDRPLDDFAPEDTANGEKQFQYFLVKWKALSYDETTWEREDDVGDDAAVKQYNDRIIRAAKRFKKIALAKHVPHNKRKNFRGYTAETPPPCKKEQSFQLRDYQLTGVNWMLFNWYQKRNSMLADEMGLGKTVQTVMYVNHLAIVERTPKPFIIVAPLSTLGHWQREFDSWTNLNAVVYHGSATAREVLQNYEFFLSEDELLRADELSGKRPANSNGKRSSPRPKRNCYRFDVLITTYEMASATDLYKLAQIDWQLMVVDEAHRLKNRNSKLSNILHTKFTYENMLLLTGTPLQNNVEELWVLLNFLDGKKFASKENFLESFGELTDSAQVERLHSELKPFLLRRMKEDVEKSLAPKEETIIEVELTVLQKQYYRAIYEKNTEFLSRGGRKGDTPSLMNVLMELRKCCNHPFLVKGVEEREVKRLAKQAAVPKEEIQRQIRESLVDTSGKLVLLDKLLPRLKETGHRVLIFSQFKIMLDILQDYLALRRYNCERIDGNITGNERQTAIDRYCREGSNSFIMLLSTRAGGVGINLTAADTVIIYDSDWNPQNDLQAQARCHRIGQKKSVKIYRLLTSKTYELHMFHKASLKLGLDQAVLGGIKNEDPVAKLKGSAKASKANQRMSKEEIENLLKHGAYEMFKEQESEAEAASKQFGEESIDQILSRSTTIVHDPTKDVDGSEKKNVMSSFSKATFVSSANPDEEVDIDDPNFWTKVIGLNGVEELKKEVPSPLQKRRCRRKVKSYLIDDRSLMMDDSGDEATRKKIFHEIGAQKDEEFVISDDDDDDDEEDSSDIALSKDDLLGIGTKGKRKRSAPPSLPIYSHTERIAEVLGNFGYGRWDDMKQHASILRGYSDKELSKFVQVYITCLVRVATAMTAFQRLGLDLEPARVYIVSTATPPPHMGNASPIERYANELSNTCRRYRFLNAMLKDMKVQNLLAVTVPPRMWITDYKSRAARGCRSKLQQMDSMYTLSQFVRAKFLPPAPIVALIKDLQKAGDEATVHRMVESGQLPLISGVAIASAAAATTTAVINSGAPPTTAVTKKEGSGSVEETKKPTTAEASPVGIPAEGSKDKIVKEDGMKKAEDAEANTPPPEDQAQKEADAGATEHPATNSPKTASTSETAASLNPESSASTTSGEVPTKTQDENTPPVEPSTSQTPSDNTTTSVSESTCNEGDNEAKDGPVPSTKGDAEKSATGDASKSGDDSQPEESKAEDKKDPSQLPGAASVASTPSATTAAVETTDAVLARLKAERKQALRILQALPPVDSPEAVAPWWISRVDDVLLLLYVYRNGWIKGRILPIRLVDASLMFGERAKRYPTSEWPTLAGLNRRVKVLLHLWTAVKKVKPTPTSIAAMLNVTTAKQQRQHELLKQQLQRQQEKERAQQARHYSSASFHGHRHNQFAKLVFSYGIPDVSTCRDDRERNEKWRYFLQDSQLSVGHCPLDQLLAEALDLERVCRQRLRSDVDGVGNSEPSEENSILGGKRGFWLLTTTQCRRLLHRVDLFRLLRTQILVLPPAQLVELVSRVVRAQGASTDYPAWWSCPRHDILLLQGVECYGLDEHLASVWKLPLFNAANTTSAFPGSSWVENYVNALALACRNLIAKARTYRNPNDGYVDLSNGEAPTSDSANGDPPRPKPTEAESRRRVRDIRGMREEDPYFVPTVRLRQLIESNAAREQATKATTSASVAKSNNASNDEEKEKLPTKAESKSSLPTSSEETARMQQEDPHQSPSEGSELTKRSDGVAEGKRPASAADGSGDEAKEKATPTSASASDEEEKAHPPSDADVIDLESDDDSSSGEEEKKSSLSARISSSVGRVAAAAFAAVKAKVQGSQDDAVKATDAAAAAAKAERAQAAPQSWDVIVIDSSDDDAD